MLANVIAQQEGLITRHRIKSFVQKEFGVNARRRPRASTARDLPVAPYLDINAATSPKLLHRLIRRHLALSHHTGVLRLAPRR